MVQWGYASDFGTKRERRRAYALCTKYCLYVDNYKHGDDANLMRLCMTILTYTESAFLWYFFRKKIKRKYYIYIYIYMELEIRESLLYAAFPLRTENAAISVWKIRR
jgi:hypothetical protein